MILFFSKFSNLILNWILYFILFSVLLNSRDNGFTSGKFYYTISITEYIDLKSGRSTIKNYI